MLARSLLFMQPREGRREELVATFERLGIARTALQQEGCISVELQVPPDEAAPVLVTALWEERSAYEGWLSNPRREETRDEIFALLTDEPEGVVYDIRIAAGNPVPAGRTEA
jgi:quinol monooxygenase YgiN